ncbi:F0F1 ATP synthase subunit epsilon [Tamlana crocina]|uniref:F0F1 ATP synthase subunit epsilon n=1 Tax=Tamlana crocina TaxID=393006 RepID=A0ABX1DC99_9FLAO|nr:F0F1 ATP synthase subunit epsilon [Tamlana crocina]NJX15990.1 F0F1 ATP synthase subunit epsilon [Tamlana crocina]
MYLEIVSPEATLFSGEVEAVTVPGLNGDFQMLNNHAAIVSSLKEGFIKISGAVTLNADVEEHFSKGENNTTLLKINSGTVEMKDNKVIVLAD